MESSLMAQYSSGGKLKLGHKNCRYWTNVEIVQMLLSSHLQLKSQGYNEEIVQYPCCGVKETKDKLQEIMANFCLYCNCNQQYLQNGSKILSKNKSLTICRGCFEDLKRKDQHGSVLSQSLDSLLIEFLNRCCECSKIIGYQNQIKNYGFCSECHREMEDGIQRQSDMNSSGSKTSKSIKTIRNFIQEEDYENSKKFDGPVEKSEKQINNFSQKLFRFDRSLYEGKENSELIDIIRRLSQRIHYLQQAKYPQRLTQSTFNDRVEASMLKSGRSFLSANQPELNHSKNTIIVNATSPVYEAQRISREILESNNDDSVNNSNFEERSQIDQSETNQFLDNLKDEKSYKNPSIGESRYAKQTQLTLDKSLLDRQEELRYLQKSTEQEKMLGSWLQSNRASKQFEQQDTEDEVNGHKSYLNVTAPVNSANNKNNPSSSANFSLRDSLQLRNSIQ